MLIGERGKDQSLIEGKEFADHPICICGYPESDGQIMSQFSNEFPGSPGNNDGYDERWKDHSNTQWFPDHTPADILEQPENNMKIFHFTESDRDRISSFCRHDMKLRIRTILSYLTLNLQHSTFPYSTFTLIPSL